jgi:hypothetical protein
MSKTFVFRIDMARDNDAYFAALRTSASLVYAGVDFRVGESSWIPDLLRLVVEEPSGQCKLTLIELEATESVALISCRKYLPENSDVILSAFTDYIDRVIRQCHSTADAREAEFARLKVVLANATQITVTTAGALRASAGFVEELPLLDQPKTVGQPQPVEQGHDDTRRTFRGIVRLPRLEAQGLYRCILILDAVVRHCDRSGTRFRHWKKESSPLCRLLSENSGTYPELHTLIHESKTAGITLDLEKVISALAEIWSLVCGEQLHPEHIRTLVSRYIPIALAIRKHHEMIAVFEEARKLVAEVGISQSHQTPGERGALAP